MPITKLLFLRHLALNHPLLTGLFLLLMALLFRLADIFLFRLDEKLGEIILSKTLGLVLIIAFARLILNGPRSIGIHSDRLLLALTSTVGMTLLALACGYSVDFARLAAAGSQPSWLFAAIDPKAGVVGGLLFAGWLILGNVINALMEEGLFRGTLLHLFGQNKPVPQANLAQAVLFGLWHLPWAVKGLLTGQYRTPGELAMGLISNFLPQVVMGLIWGSFYLSTGNLWGAVVSHLLINTTFNLLHIQTTSGLDEGMPVRMVALLLIAGLGAWLSPIILQKFSAPLFSDWPHNPHKSS